MKQTEEKCIKCGYEPKGRGWMISHPVTCPQCGAKQWAPGQEPAEPAYCEVHAVPNLRAGWEDCSECRKPSVPPTRTPGGGVGELVDNALAAFVEYNKAYCTHTMHAPGECIEPGARKILTDLEAAAYARAIGDAVEALPKNKYSGKHNASHTWISGDGFCNGCNKTLTCEQLEEEFGWNQAIDDTRTAIKSLSPQSHE